MLLMTLTVANLVLLCVGGDNIFMFHKTNQTCEVSEGQHVSLRCESKGDVGG